jgi:hypothetical protein
MVTGTRRMINVVEEIVFESCLQNFARQSTTTITLYTISSCVVKYEQ